MFLSLPNTVGKPLSVDTPDPFGPRKRFQLSPTPSRGFVSAPRHSRQRNGNRNLGISQLSHDGSLDLTGAQTTRADSANFGKILGASNLQQAELALRIVSEA